MKRLLLATLFLLPTPVLADDVTVGVSAVSEKWMLSADEQTMFNQWVQYAYPCKVVPPATTCTALTLAESESLWAQATLQGTINNVNQYHRYLAAQEAAKAVTPITIPPPLKVIKKK